MEQIPENKKEFILEPYYSLDGLLELVKLLETSNPKDLFPGNLLHVTRKIKEFKIDNRLIEKLKSTNNSYQLKGIYGDSNTFLDIEKRIESIENKFNLNN